MRIPRQLPALTLAAALLLAAQPVRAAVRYAGPAGVVTNPASTSVTSVDIKKAWITVKGVTTAGGLNLDYPARYDSVAWCIGTGGHFYGAKYCMLARNSISGTFAFLLDLAQTLSGTSNCEYDTLRGNTIDIGLVPAYHGFKIRGYTQNCLIDSNRVTGTFTQTGANDGCGRIFYNSSYNTLRDNFWKFEATNDYNANKDPWNGFVLRDSASHYTFERDTVYLGVNSGPYQVHGVMCSSGTYVNSVGDNVWTDCVFKTNSYVSVQNGLRNVTIQRCVFASSAGNALWVASSVDNTVMDHNTFVSSGQALNFGDVFTGANRITSNIIYSGPVGPIANYGAQTQYNQNAVTGFTQDYNVFFTPSYTSQPGDRALMWCCYTGSRPGPGTPWAALNGQDTHSRHGSPAFVDSSLVTLDPRLRTGSAAIGAGEGGTDAGAIPFTAAGADVTPPAAVSDLATGSITAQSLLLTWTAPGDDGMVGLAFAYDLRMSTSPITAANFASATAVAPQPTPVLGGSAQSYVVTGLTPGATYYFAIKARDDVNNWATISNVPTATTPSTDTTAPASIKDLGAGP